MVNKELRIKSQNIGGIYIYIYDWIPPDPPRCFSDLLLHNWWVYLKFCTSLMDIMRGLHPTVVSRFRVNMFFLRKHVYKVYYTKKNMFTKFTTQRKTCLQSLLHKEKHVYKVYYTKKTCLQKKVCKSLLLQ